MGICSVTWKHIVLEPSTMNYKDTLGSLSLSVTGPTHLFMTLSSLFSKATESLRESKRARERLLYSHRLENRSFVRSPLSLVCFVALLIISSYNHKWIKICFVVTQLHLQTLVIIALKMMITKTNININNKLIHYFINTNLLVQPILHHQISIYICMNMDYYFFATQMQMRSHLFWYLVFSSVAYGVMRFESKLVAHRLVSSKYLPALCMKYRLQKS